MLILDSPALYLTQIFIPKPHLYYYNKFISPQQIIDQNMVMNDL